MQSKPLIICLIGNFLPGAKALDCIHPACFCLSAESVSPSRGTRVWNWFAGVCQGFEAVVVEGFVGFAEGVYKVLFTVLQGVYNTFSFFWQTVEHTLFIFIHIFLKSNFVIL